MHAKGGRTLRKGVSLPSRRLLSAFHNSPPFKRFEWYAVGPLAALVLAPVPVTCGGTVVELQAKQWLSWHCHMVARSDIGMRGIRLDGADLLLPAKINRVLGTTALFAS